MTVETFEEALKLVQSTDPLSPSDSFDLARYCAANIGNGHTDQARDIVIRSFENREHIHRGEPSIWLDLAEAAGLYPYLEGSSLSDSLLLRLEYHRSRVLPDVVFHEEQVAVSEALLGGKSVVLSAPTSFGKSLLIEEVVASRTYANIVIVQPTIALLDETRKRLQKYGDTYKIVMSTSQESSAGQNLYLFTPERVVEYKHFVGVDFFVIDEFYKLSTNRDDVSVNFTARLQESRR